MPAETTSEAAPTTAHHPWAQTLLSAAPFVALGVLAVAYLRTLGGPSLWLDEAWEANYYVGVEPSPWYNRPVLYMAAVRALVALFGPHEMVLRLLPCLAGLGAVALTFALVRREVGEPAAWIAAAVLAVAPPFLFHAHVLKNYTLDALFAAALALAWCRWRDRRAGRDLAVFAALGALSFGFSFTGAFVVAACAAGEAWEHRRALRALVPFVVVCAALAALFAAVFLVWHAGATGDDLLQAYFAEGYPPASPAAWLRWAAPLVVGVVRDQTGIVSGVAAVALAGAGLWLAGRRRAGPLTWGLPALGAVHLGASAAHVYPFGVDRLSLDLAPFACAAVGTALAALLPTGGRARAAGALALAGVAWVLFHPALAQARPYLTTGWRREHVRPLVEELSRRYRPAEAIYVSEGAGPAFAFYWWRAGRDPKDPRIVQGERHRLRPAEHAPQVDALAASHAALWCLYAHLPASELTTLRRLFAERYVTVGRWGEGDVGLDRLARRQPAGMEAP